MADLSKKKSDAISKFVSLVLPAVKLSADINELNTFLTDCGFLTGGANALVDGDFTGSNAFLDAATFNAAVTALVRQKLSTSNLTALHKASTVPATNVA